MKYFSVLLLAFTTLFFSCKTEKKDQEPTQMERVIGIHDEVMPKMGDVAKLITELKPMADSTQAGQEYEQAITDLQAAHKSMMDWMKGFGDRFDADEVMNGKELSEQKQEWLNEEQEKVEAMRDQMNESIARAEALLKE